MTISKKQRMLNIISDLQASSVTLPHSIETKLSDARLQLEKSSTATVEQYTNKVVSSPPSEMKLNLHSPENLLRSTYDELEQLSKQMNVDRYFQEALQKMGHYFNIEESGGYFP